MSLIALLEIEFTSSKGRSSAGGLLVLAAIIGFAILRSRRSKGPPVPLPQARQAFDEMEKGGRRDPRTEGHIVAFMSWCRTYAILTAVSCAAIAYMSLNEPQTEEGPSVDRGTLALFAGVAVLEGLGIWAGGRLLARGEERGRWISCAALTAVALSGASAVAMRVLHWSPEDKVDFNLLLHGTLTFYSLAGATFLVLPRSARLCTPEYRAALEPEESPETRGALQLGRMKSVFSWIPLLMLAASFVLHYYHKASGAGTP